MTQGSVSDESFPQESSQALERRCRSWSRAVFTAPINVSNSKSLTEKQFLEKFNLKRSDIFSDITGLRWGWLSVFVVVYVACCDSLIHYHVYHDDKRIICNFTVVNWCSCKKAL